MNKATLIELCSLQEKLIKSYEERERASKAEIARLAAKVDEYHAWITRQALAGKELLDEHARVREALAEAIKYIELDSELPPMIFRWREALSGAAEDAKT